MKLQLGGEFAKRKLLAMANGDEGHAIQARWEAYRRKLCALGEQGGDRLAPSHVLEPLAESLGWERIERQAEVITREGPEDGGWLFTTGDGRAYSFNPSRVA